MREILVQFFELWIVLHLGVERRQTIEGMGQCFRDKPPATDRSIRYPWVRILRRVSIKIGSAMFAFSMKIVILVWSFTPFCRLRLQQRRPQRAEFAQSLWPHCQGLAHLPILAERRYRVAISSSQTLYPSRLLAVDRGYPV